MIETHHLAFWLKSIYYAAGKLEYTERFLKLFCLGEKIIRIGFCDSGEVYIVPVNYGYTVSEGKYIFY